MYVIKLKNEIFHGVLWVYEDGIESYYELIDEDVELEKLNDETEILFNSCYEIDSHDQPCWLNKEREKEIKDQMLELIQKIKDRLAVLDDGSFVVEDHLTERLKRL